MSRTPVILVALAILLLIGPSLGDERVREIQDLLTQVSTEIAEQLDILSQQEEQGLESKAAGTRTRIFALIEKQRSLLSHLEKALAGEAEPAPVAPPPEPTPDDQLDSAITSGLS